MSGKYFYIRSQMNGLVLDIEGGQSHAGARVLMWNQKPGYHDNQLWYQDHMTGTIRSKLNDMCLDLAGDQMVMQPHNPSAYNQQLMVVGARIQSRTSPNRVLDVAAWNQNPGARVCMWDYNGGANQHWSVEYIPPRYFHIQSNLNGKVLDVEANNPSAGARVIMYGQKMPPSDNQLWYEDSHGVIRSKMNDFALDASRNNMCLMPHNPNNSKMQWVLSGNRIVNRHNPNSCLDIIGHNAADCAPLCAYNYHGASNQHWQIKYV